MPYRQLAILGAYVRNRFADAVPLLQKAVALDPDNPTLNSISPGFTWTSATTSGERVIEAARRRWPDQGLCSIVVAHAHADGERTRGRADAQQARWRSIRVIATIVRGCATPT